MELKKTPIKKALDKFKKLSSLIYVLYDIPLGDKLRERNSSVFLYDCRNNGGDGYDSIICDPDSYYHCAGQADFLQYQSVRGSGRVNYFGDEKFGSYRDWNCLNEDDGILFVNGSIYVSQFSVVRLSSIRSSGIVIKGKDIFSSRHVYVRGKDKVVTKDLQHRHWNVKE